MLQWARQRRRREKTVVLLRGMRHRAATAFPPARVRLLLIGLRLRLFLLVFPRGVRLISIWPGRLVRGSQCTRSDSALLVYTWSSSCGRSRAKPADDIFAPRAALEAYEEESGERPRRSSSDWRKESAKQRAEKMFTLPVWRRLPSRSARNVSGCGYIRRDGQKPQEGVREPRRLDAFTQALVDFPPKGRRRRASSPLVLQSFWGRFFVSSWPWFSCIPRPGSIISSLGSNRACRRNTTPFRPAMPPWRARLSI